MDIRQLRYFVAVADEGTVSAAAKALHMSQPPLSAQLKQLEDELGCLLFDRGTRHMALTEAGKLLYKRAVDILGSCVSAQAEVRDCVAGRAGTLQIGTVTSVAGSKLPELVRAYHLAYPSVRLEIIESNTYELLEYVRTGRIEAALVRTPFSAPDLNISRFKHEPLCAVGAEDILPPGVERLTLKQLQEYPLLIYRRWDRVLRDAFLKVGLHPTIVCTSDDARTAVSLARAGIGLAIAPKSALPPAGSGLRSVHIDSDALHSTICTVCRKDQYISAAAKNILEMAAAILSN